MGSSSDSVHVHYRDAPRRDRVARAVPYMCLCACMSVGMHVCIDRSI